MKLGSRYNQHSFAQIPSIHIPRSNFDRSFTKKDTFDFDYLTPCFIDEVVPGDTINLSMQAFARLTSSATKVPIMDNYFIDVEFFYSPSRTLWDHFVNMMGEQRDPGDSIDYIYPQITAPVGGFAVGSIYDHLGIPTTGADGYAINALPLRMYNQIYNYWYRDQNLQDSLVDNYDSDGPDAYTDYVLKKSNKAHDYFTSMTKEPQKGDPVTLPLGTSAPVLTNGIQPTFNTNAQVNQGLSQDTGGKLYLPNTPGAAQAVKFGNQSGLYTDLNDATSATVNSLLTAIQLQQFLHVDSISGTRYPEMVMGHFNVVVPDFRVQKPEFLGSARFKFNSHPVAQTSPTSGSNALGQLAAFATAAQVGSNAGFTKSFVEHGFVMGIMRARADITYQQGLNRMWTRSTRYDVYDPLLQEIGDQAVYGQELMVAPGGYNTTVIGYQERNADMRYMPSQICGLFRSQVSGTLDIYHLAEKFTTAPTFNGTFIESNTPIERTLAVTTGPDILMDMWFKYYHTRPMMVRAVPAAFTRF